MKQKSLEVRVMKFSVGYQAAVWSEEGLYALGFPKESPEAALAQGWKSLFVVAPDLIKTLRVYSDASDLHDASA